MGVLDKRAYEGKRAYAMKRMQKNAENPNLTEAQHNTLAWLCMVRHNIHTSGDSFVQSEQSDFEELWNMIPTNFDGPGEINRRLKKANLPTIRFPNYFYCCDYDLYESYLRDDTIAYLRRRGFLRGRNVDTYDIMNALVWYAQYLTDSVNKRIEDYLTRIDRKYGTSYCPTGQSRIYRRRINPFQGDKMCINPLLGD